MKKLVVSLLPITFLFVACGGHEESASVTASSTSAPIASNSSGPPASTSPAPAPLPAASPAPSSVAVAPNGNGPLAITNYHAARGTTTSPIVIQQQPQQVVNLAEVLASVPRITPQEAKAKVDSGKALIVDVRSIIRRQIKGSRHIPLAQLPLLMKDLPKDKTIITYCTCPHEEEATRGALELKQAGFKGPVALGGGLNAWENAGFPTEPPQ